jgi:hypothetical protein
MNNPRGYPMNSNELRTIHVFLATKFDFPSACVGFGLVSTNIPNKKHVFFCKDCTQNHAIGCSVVSIQHILENQLPYIKKKEKLSDSRRPADFDPFL